MHCTAFVTVWLLSCSLTCKSYFGIFQLLPVCPSQKFYRVISETDTAENISPEKEK